MALVTVVAWVQSLAQTPPYISGVAKKKKSAQFGGIKCIHICATIPTIYLWDFFNFCNSISVLIKYQLLIPSLPAPGPHHLSVAINLTPLGTSYEWNHAMFGSGFH